MDKSFFNRGEWLRSIGVTDPIQDNCKHGWVLPDRCRYDRRLGCDCGAYPGTMKKDLEVLLGGYSNE